MSSSLNYNYYKVKQMEINQGFGVVKVQESENLPIKSRRLLKTLKQRQSSFKFYSWDIVENYSYITYLTNFRYIFDSQAERKRVKVFRHLSKLIKTRNPHQIKSHHQKMMLRHRTVDQIIEYLRIKITKELSLKPEYISVIEKINKEAQEFFINELAVNTTHNCQNIQKNFRSKREERKPTPAIQNPEVKMQEGPTYYFCSELKKQQAPAAPQEAPCLKQQDKQDMIVRICQ